VNVGPYEKKIKRTAFLLNDYAIRIWPTQGTLLCFNTGIVYHETCKNEGYTQIGLTLCNKPQVMKKGLEVLDKNKYNIFR
jgi:hypothetical protein